MEQPAISSDLIRGHIDTIILHTLLDGDKFAQQISDAIESKSDGEYKINQATLYSSLKRLETLKLATSYWYDSEAGGRRKYFKLTADGKSTVEANLGSWSFSRAIIDKLMDCSPEPVYKTKYIEKIVEVPIATTSAPEVINTINAQQDEKEVKPIENNLKSEPETVQEINFRNVLNGLIKSTAVKKPTKTEIEPLEKEEIKTEEVHSEKLKFNETITSNDYNVHKANNSSKIDFGDLMLKAAKEGYKIKISSKDSGVAEGKILINKLKLFSALLIYLFAVAEFLVFTFGFKSVLQFKTTFILITLAILTAYPIFEIINFLYKPTKKSPKLISLDSLLTAAIVVFNLFLICVI